MYISDRELLRTIILEHSLKRGDFTLTSGKKSNVYLDCKNTTLHPEGAYLCGRLFYDMILNEGLDIYGIGGITLGADPIVTSISLISQIEGNPIPAFIIRKEKKGHGTGSWIEGKGNILVNSEVALVEDVVTTGGSLIKAIKRTKEEGFKVVMTMTIVDREEGGDEAILDMGLPLYSIFKMSELLKN